jgi:hypothetical protein
MLARQSRFIHHLDPNFITEQSNIPCAEKERQMGKSLNIETIHCVNPDGLCTQVSTRGWSLQIPSTVEWRCVAPVRLSFLLPASLVAVMTILGHGYKKAVDKQLCGPYICLYAVLDSAGYRL